MQRIKHKSSKESIRESRQVDPVTAPFQIKKKKNVGHIQLCFFRPPQTTTSLAPPSRSATIGVVHHQCVWEISRGKDEREISEKFLKRENKEIVNKTFTKTTVIGIFTY
jgi:hypothetical protein